MAAPLAPSDAASGDNVRTRTPLARSSPQVPGWMGSGGPPEPDGPDGPDLDDEVEPPGEGEAVELNLEIEDGETTLFEAAVVAFHSGEFQRAESLFLEEAQRTIDSAPQRAAISYRQAALAARRIGNMDASDHWMRLAGREYLRVTEDDRTPLPFIREAAMMAAKCFLSVENLNVASKGLRRAQAIESVLRADDDLMSGVPGIPFRHGDAAPAADADSEAAPATPVTPLASTPSDPGRPTPGPRTADPATSDDEPATSSPRSGRIQRVRQYRARRNVA